MGAFVKLIDAMLFLYFLLIAVAAPVLDAQTCIPAEMFPSGFVDLKKWYAREYGDYLVEERPSFFVGVVWLELIFQWPLALLNLYAILASKSWFNTTCLIYGVSTLSTMSAIVGDMMVSEKASDTLKMIYYPFIGVAVLAILRGLTPQTRRTISPVSRGSVLARRKKA